MECNGVGFFSHWREGRTREQVESDLNKCRELQKTAVSDDELHYWACYVQQYAREIFEID
jgi:hypothetical protein